jgi:hypothetical protein
VLEGERAPHVLEEAVERRALVDKPAVQRARRHPEQAGRDRQRREAVLLLEQEPPDASRE